MSSHSQFAPGRPLDLSRWRNVPNWAIGAGIVLAGLGAVLNLKQFGYSWLLAFMFFLSLGLGSLFLVIVHHLFDAGWSVPIRRFCEHLACLTSPWMALFFIPIALLASRIYPWMGPELQAAPDHALLAKFPLFTKPAFYGVAAFCFFMWWLISSRLRNASIKQDETGAAAETHTMRRWAALGIFFFAVTLTLAGIMWMKALSHEWFSTMYGVYYFAGSVWMTLATAYLITTVLERVGLLRGLLHQHQYYFLGTLFFAFTVFYAYIHLSQYFIIWNANVPEEIFYYKLRERGTWFGVSMVLIFGHFFLPFLSLLRIDAKHFFPIMGFMAVWAWLMHYVDLSFNIMPALHPDGFPLRWVWLDLGCMALIGGVLAKVFLKNLMAHPPYPVRDPRLGEALGLYHPKPRLMSGGELGETEEIEDEIDAEARPNTEGGAQ